MQPGAGDHGADGPDRRRDGAPLHPQRPDCSMRTPPTISACSAAEGWTLPPRAWLRCSNEKRPPCRLAHRRLLVHPRRGRSGGPPLDPRSPGLRVHPSSHPLALTSAATEPERPTTGQGASTVLRDAMALLGRLIPPRAGGQRCVSGERVADWWLPWAARPAGSTSWAPAGRVKATLQGSAALQ
jgi:hypothetical protein